MRTTRGWRRHPLQTARPHAHAHLALGSSRYHATWCSAHAAPNTARGAAATGRARTRRVPASPLQHAHIAGAHRTCTPQPPSAAAPRTRRCAAAPGTNAQRCTHAWHACRAATVVRVRRVRRVRRVHECRGRAPDARLRHGTVDRMPHDERQSSQRNTPPDVAASGGVLRWLDLRRDEPAVRDGRPPRQPSGWLTKLGRPSASSTLAASVPGSAGSGSITGISGSEPLSTSTSL